MATERILIVDDNPSNMKLVSFLLSNRGYDVLTASDATQALAILQRERPRLVLMDLQMPGMDGFELTRRVRAEESTRDTIIIAVTAFAMAGDEERARRAGCDGYITKPIDTRRLPGLIEGYLTSTRPEGR